MFTFFKKLLSPFSKMKSALGQKIRALFSRPLDEATFERLEQLLYEADLGSSIAAELTEKARLYLRKNSPETLLSFLQSELLQIFVPPPPLPSAAPHVLLIVGVNGSGKTTTIAKLASHYQRLGKKILIAAADTFRAAAVEQLETWAQRISVPLIKSQPHGDPSAVAFDAIAAAKVRAIDIVLIDTAGRLQTKKDLMQELEKLRRVCQKQIPEAPHETLLVLDATMGQNALDQARTFHQSTPITGIALTKLDAAAKGGIAVAIQKELKIPICWVGLGEKEEDLVPFDPQTYVAALLNSE